MNVVENENHTKEYFDADKRTIGNSVQVFFKDSTSTDKVAVDYSIGHQRRRDEGMPVLKDKLERSIRGKLSQKNANKLVELCNESRFTH